MKHIIFYDDNPDFGGHQFMAMRGVAAASRCPDLRTTLVLNPCNDRLLAYADDIRQGEGQLDVRHSPVITKKFQALLNHVSGKSINELARLFTELKPDLIVCFQGEIEDSSLSLLAAKRSNHRIMSYIPVAHKMAQMGAKLGGVRDLTTGYLFKTPDCWMTISQCIARMLRARGAEAPIHIVENGIDTVRFQPRDSLQRREQTLPDGLIFGVFGRVEFNQKQQDFLVRAMSKWSGEFANAKLMVVGDGPDYDRLKQLITELGMDGRVLLCAWEKEPEKLYSALDCLIIPSRFEGFPLVMLEAAACGVPVVGSDNDGMHDFLPAPWRFQQGDEVGLIKALDSAVNSPFDLAYEQRKRVLENHTLQQFEDRFLQTLRHELT